jgi:hypothetical protein
MSKRRTFVERNDYDMDAQTCITLYRSLGKIGELTNKNVIKTPL